MSALALDTPPSPFRDGVQWAWDSTSLGWFKECPRKYYYHMVKGYVGKSENVHLEFGILYHTALETYDKRRHLGASHDEAVCAMVKDTLLATWRDGKPWRSAVDLPSEDKASLKCRENLIRTIVWYADKYRNDPAQTIIGPDGPMVELHFEFEIGGGYTLCGYLDRVVNFQSQSFVMDRKTTTTTLSSYYFQNYSPDNQMSLYSVAAQVAFHTPVSGVIVDAAQIAVGFSRFGRAFATRTRGQLEEWLEDTRQWIRRAAEYSYVGRWPMNDKACGLYGGCPFRGICDKDPEVRERFLESNFTKREWNPLIPR